MRASSTEATVPRERIGPEMRVAFGGLYDGRDLYERARSVHDGDGPMYILGLMGRRGTACHDGSAAIFGDGQVVTAIEQERVSRNKHAPGEAPADATEVCLEAAGIGLDDVDHVTYGWLERGLEDGEEVGEFVTKSETFVEDILPPSEFDYDTPPAVHFVKHHVTHLMAAVVESGFGDAACLVADGRGENESVTLAEYSDGTIREIATYPVSRSLGIFYDAASHYCGLGQHGSGKLMGLASYGSPVRSGWFDFDPETGTFDLPIESAEDSSTVFGNWLSFFEDQFYPYRSGDEECIMYYQDFARTVQEELSSVVASLASYLEQRVSSDNLVFGGGVGLNCVINRELHRSGYFDDVFVFPASNDSGAAIGSIYELCRVLGTSTSAGSDQGGFDPYKGPTFDDHAKASALANRDLTGTKLTEDELLARVSAALADDAVVGWFQGGSEFGPRALGHRSLLADPSNRANLSVLNDLKGRAPWRPLAPSILAEEFETVFEGECSRTLANYMLTTSRIKEEWRAEIPAVTHVDGTSRPQLVHESSDERYHDLLERFYARTGVPLLINTSFNLSGEPIVNTPSEAVETFVRAPEMDVLVLGNRYVEREPVDASSGDSPR